MNQSDAVTNHNNQPDSNPTFDYQKLEAETPRSWNTGDFDRRFAYSRQTSFNREQPTPVSIISNGYSTNKPRLSRTSSKIDIFPTPVRGYGSSQRIWSDSVGKIDTDSYNDDSVSGFVFSLVNVIRSGNKPMKRLVTLISLNVACSTAELLIGLLSGQAGTVSLLDIIYWFWF